VLSHIHLFWWRWLLVVTIVLVTLSLSFIILPNVMHDIFSTLFFSSSKTNTFFSDDARKYIIVVYRVLGAVMVGWSVALLCILSGPFRRGDREAWYAIALSIGIWFVLDTGFSFYSGFVANIILNTVFFIFFAVPLTATYRHFHKVYQKVYNE